MRIAPIIAITAVMMGTLVPIGAAEQGEEILQKTTEILQRAGIKIDPKVHFLRGGLFVKLAVEQAGMPPESSGATLKVRMNAGDTPEYHSFIKVEDDSTPISLSLSVVHEFVHLKARRRNESYTALEEAKAIRAEVNLIETQVGKIVFNLLKKQVQKLSNRSEIGGGWTAVTRSSPESRREVLVALGLSSGELMQAHNLVLALCNDDERLAFIISQSQYREFLTSSSFR